MSEHQQRRDLERARAYVRQEGKLKAALQALFPQPEAGAVANSARLRQFAREQWLAQGLCRLFIGEGYVRPVPDPGGSGTRSGSGARRTRQKNEVRPGHYDKQGVMVFGPVTLTRKGLKVLEDSCEN